MESVKLILTLITCIGLALFVCYKMILFFSDENDKARTKKGRARQFFHGNMTKNERERRLYNDQFNLEVFKTKIQAHLFPAAIATLLIVLVLNTMMTPKENNNIPIVPIDEQLRIAQERYPKVTRKEQAEEPKIQSQPILKNDEINSWVDDKGTKHYTNAKIEQEGTSRETPIIITANNSILIPVIIGHRGKTIKTTMLLDTGCGLTLFHHPIAEQLHPDFVQNSTSTIADGRKINTSIIRVDSLQVGPFMEPNFIASTSYIQNTEKLDHQGLLGMEFLKRHPYQIDMQRKMIRWL